MGVLRRPARGAFVGKRVEKEPRRGPKPGVGGGGNCSFIMVDESVPNAMYWREFLKNGDGRGRERWRPLQPLPPAQVAAVGGDVVTAPANASSPSPTPHRPAISSSSFSVAVVGLYARPLPPPVAVISVACLSPPPADQPPAATPSPSSRLPLRLLENQTFFSSHGTSDKPYPFLSQLCQAYGRKQQVAADTTAGLLHSMKEDSRP
ncbi:unnamed protein product [Urochloa humidicola]